MKLKLDPRSKLHNASRILSKIGIELQIDSLAQKATLAQIEELAVFGQDESLQLREVVENINSFDQLVANNLKSMNVGERYNDIRENFETILKDLERKLKGADGSQNMGSKLVERIQNKLVLWRRGSVKDRYDKIKVISESVFADSDSQIKHEQAIIEAYRDYREALRDSGTLAKIIKERAAMARDSFKDEYTSLVDQLKEAQDSNAETLAVALLQQQVDDIKRQFDAADRRHEIASSLEQKLTTTYGISDAVMTRYTQTAEVRERLQREAALYYSVNSGVMTTLMATFQQLEATNEGTQVLREIQKQQQKALDSLSRNGGLANKVVQEAQKVGMSVYFSAEDMRKLYASTVEFRINQARDYAKLRQERDANMIEVQKAIQEGQRKLSEVQIQIVNEKFESSNSSTSARSVHTQAKAVEIDIPVPQMSADRLKKKSQDEEAPPRKRTASSP